jgi:hypothetical protein
MFAYACLCLLMFAYVFTKNNNGYCYKKAIQYI